MNYNQIAKALNVDFKVAKRACKYKPNVGARFIAPQTKGAIMFNIYALINPKLKYIWVQVRILHETEKAILVTAPLCHSRIPHCHSRGKLALSLSKGGNPNNDNIKIWIAKSQIYGIRLKKNVFEVYVKESVVG